MNNLKKIEITIPEAQMLIQELNGEEGFKGLFSQSISLSAKFDLKTLFSKSAELVKTAEELRVDYIKENGSDVGDGNFQISKTIESDEDGQVVPNPKFQAYQVMYIELMGKKHTIEIKKLNPSDFDFKAEEVYPVFLEILTRINDAE